MPPRRSQRIAGSAASGALVGLATGIVYCAWIGLLYLFHGSEVFEARGLRMELLVLFYLVAGAAGGAVVGGLRRWRSSYLGARVVGVIAMLPLAFGAEILVKGYPLNWETKHWVLMICLGAAIGIVMGGSFQIPASEDS